MRSRLNRVRVLQDRQSRRSLLDEGNPGYSCWGEEYYGTFFRALYTMFQVLTGESWSEAGARPAIAYYAGKDDVLYTMITYFFFYSFILVNQMTLLNVVVAVLMDGMQSESPPEAPPEEGEDS